MNVPNSRITAPILRIFALVLLVSGLAGCAEPPYTNIDNAELKTLSAQGVPVYDIRTAEEWRQTGIVEGSRKLTFFTANGGVNPEFMQRFGAEVGKNDPVILICRSGNRTDALGRHLVEKLGYTRVYNVEDGIRGWIADDLPVVRN